MDELVRANRKKQERSDLLGKVARILEAADKENRSLNAIQDAAVMEIVREAQHLEAENAESFRHTEKPQGTTAEIKKRQRIALLEQIAQILESPKLTSSQELAVQEMTKQAQDLGAEICEISKGGETHSYRVSRNS